MGIKNKLTVHELHEHILPELQGVRDIFTEISDFQARKSSEKHPIQFKWDLVNSHILGNDPLNQLFQNARTAIQVFLQQHPYIKQGGSVEGSDELSEALMRIWYDNQLFSLAAIQERAKNGENIAGALEALYKDLIKLALDHTQRIYKGVLEQIDCILNGANSQPLILGGEPEVTPSPDPGTKRGDPSSERVKVKEDPVPPSWQDKLLNQGNALLKNIDASMESLEEYFQSLNALESENMTDALRDVQIELALRIIEDRYDELYPYCIDGSTISDKDDRARISKQTNELLQFLETCEIENINISDKHVTLVLDDTRHEDSGIMRDQKFPIKDVCDACRGLQQKLSSLTPSGTDADSYDCIGLDGRQNQGIPGPDTSERELYDEILELSHEIDSNRNIHDTDTAMKQYKRLQELLNTFIIQDPSNGDAILSFGTVPHTLHSLRDECSKMILHISRTRDIIAQVETDFYSLGIYDERLHQLPEGNMFDSEADSLNLIQTVNNLRIEKIKSSSFPEPYKDFLGEKCESLNGKIANIKSKIEIMEKDPDAASKENSDIERLTALSRDIAALMGKLRNREKVTFESLDAIFGEFETIVPIFQTLQTPNNDDSSEITQKKQDISREFIELEDDVTSLRFLHGIIKTSEDMLGVLSGQQIGEDEKTLNLIGECNSLLSIIAKVATSILEPVYSNLMNRYVTAIGDTYTHHIKNLSAQFIASYETEGDGRLHTENLTSEKIMEYYNTLLGFVSAIQQQIENNPYFTKEITDNMLEMPEIKKAEKLLTFCNIEMEKMDEGKAEISGNVLPPNVQPSHTNYQDKDESVPLAITPRGEESESMWQKIRTFFSRQKVHKATRNDIIEKKFLDFLHSQYSFLPEDRGGLYTPEKIDTHIHTINDFGLLKTPAVIKAIEGNRDSKKYYNIWRTFVNDKVTDLKKKREIFLSYKNTPKHDNSTNEPQGDLRYIVDATGIPPTITEGVSGFTKLTEMEKPIEGDGDDFIEVIIQREAKEQTIREAFGTTEKRKIFYESDLLTNLNAGKTELIKSVIRMTIIAGAGKTEVTPDMQVLEVLLEQLRHHTIISDFITKFIEHYYFCYYTPKPLKFNWRTLRREQQGYNSELNSLYFGNNGKNGNLKALENILQYSPHTPQNRPDGEPLHPLQEDPELQPA